MARPLTFGSLFAGIGGFDLGFERAGMVCKWQVEIDDYCTRVLEKHWPEVKRYRDVKEIHGALAHANGRDSNGRERQQEWRQTGRISLNGNGKERDRAIDSCLSCLEPVDIICGGFPCQPHSHAGKRKGAEDDRDLWPEFKRIIDEVRPRWVVAENVPGIRTTILDSVLSDLEGMGYAWEAAIIPACAVDAPHRRDRVWIVANSDNEGLEGWNSGIMPECTDQWTSRPRSPSMADTEGRTIRAGLCQSESGRKRGRRFSNGNSKGTKWLPESRLGGVVDGPARWLDEPGGIPRVANNVPDRVNRLRALGNAVVPQVTEFIGRLIIEVENG